LAEPFRPQQIEEGMGTKRRLHSYHSCEKQRQKMGVDIEVVEK
jgi:hypothetical protein